MPRFLQVCNVGQIVGGTAACAWTVTRALTDFEHHVLFLSPPDRGTIATFASVPVTSATTISPDVIAAIRPNVILLHNTSAARIMGTWPVPTVQYLHSAISSAARADVTVCCSHWLSRRVGLSRNQVMWQAVPSVISEAHLPRRSRSDEVDLVIGRFCTPQQRKWPLDVVPFYSQLARNFPRVRWEFVGCPFSQREELMSACRGRAVFYSAGWEQRALLARWDVMLYSNPSLPESFGRTAAEAMRAGCIPVVDRQGGFVEQIPTGCGFLCDTLDEFVAAVDHVGNPSLRQTMSENARRHADREFSLERFVSRLRRWLDHAMNGRSANRD